LLACATDDGSIHVFEALTGKLRTIYRGHRLRVHDVAWSPDSRYIVSGGNDTTVQIWDALTGRTMLIYHGHMSTIEGVDWSFQGKYIASCSDDLTAQAWEAFTGRLAARYEVNDIVETVLWARDGTTIVTGTAKQGIAFWPAPQ
jgi:WD40 repeat protein